MAADRLARLDTAVHRLVARQDAAGVVALVARRGQIVALDTAGYADLEAKRPMRPSTIFRIASMSKPVTAVAVMLLVEEGRLKLNDPVGRYIPAFDSVRVVMTSTDAAGHKSTKLVPATHGITIHDLLTHRSGLSYGFLDTSAVGAAYRRAGVVDGIAPTTGTIGDNIERLAHQPLLFEPGARWQYSLAMDVLGRVIEVASGMPFDRFLRERLFAPLKMDDTDFYVPDEKLDRLAVPYTHQGDALRRFSDPERFNGGNLVMGGPRWRGSRSYFSGGAGLFSTTGDYARFLQMLLNGGELDGVRLLSPKSVELMTSSATEDLGPSAIEPGAGYGLGVAVVTNLGQRGALGSAGTFFWGGIYGTDFFVDPREQLLGLIMTQVFPARTPGNEVLEPLTYQAITESGVRRAEGRE
jgi:CubicO group peptidase (beta-lactamase class C family)